MVLNLIAALVTTFAVLASFAAVLSQFVGSSPETLTTFANLQFVFLIIVAVLIGLIFFQILKKWPKKGFLKAFFVDMPGWLIFVLLLLLFTAVLGDLSVYLVRNTEQKESVLFHVPTLCVVVYCFAYRLIYLNHQLDT